MATTEKKSKTQRILEHLQNGWELSQLEATKRFRTIRLGGIIYHLRKKHNIETITRRSEDGANYAVYKYIKERVVEKSGTF